ncbi:MAG TPA: phosphoadenosine phosphosulfate reductase family protein [Pirellulaceae bacterium]|nr:phosphoadenosine phosphosulfate reductase family protein [Pirellulaceae bacterium]
MSDTVATTPEVDALLSQNAPVAIGVSGGKDSSAVAFATVAHLDRIGHCGERLLIHSDLGATEWRDSLPWCHKLASRLGLELVVVRRAKGDMMDRWEQRWSDNCRRYVELSCVQLILPWSTPGMRFCTSEMKTSVICRELTDRFPGQTIISVTGIRRDESRGRQNAPIYKPQPKLTSKTRQTTGIDWHPIAHWPLKQVFAYLQDQDFPLHPAYAQWGMSRVSCAFCIMSSMRDIAASVRCPDNHDLYRRMVALELRSTFAFQGDKWLADVAPELLSSADAVRIPFTKLAAKHRQESEALVPRHLLYTKGWPTCIPTETEAELLCQVRMRVAGIVGLEIGYTSTSSLISRYRALYEQKHGEGGK